jgi:hypothetical protein
VQAKLDVRGPDDEYEQEADRTAEMVMRMPYSSRLDEKEVEPEPIPTAIQRPRGDCDELPKSTIEERKVQARAAAGGLLPLSSEANAAVHELRGRGQPLSATEREFFEPRFGRDLGQVRLHAGELGNRAARSLNAKALTLGSDVAFRTGEYRPGESSGRRLLAHELTHVLQQGGGEPARHARSGLAATARPVVSQVGGDPGGAVVQRSPGPEPGPERRGVEATEGEPARVVDVIVDALEGFTSGNDSERIRTILLSGGPAWLRSVMAELIARGNEHEESPAGMIDWLLGDLAAGDDVAVRDRLIAYRALPDTAAFAAREIEKRLEGYTGEDSSLAVRYFFEAFASDELDEVLVHLQRLTELDEGGLADWMHSDLDRVTVFRLARWFRQNGPKALSIAARWYARKIVDLLSGYTSLTDSEGILANFREFDVGRPVLLAHLDTLTRAELDLSAEDALVRDMHPFDYQELCWIPGIGLEWKPPPVEALVKHSQWALLDWIGRIVEWTGCGLVGIITGLLSVVWDIVVLVWDVAKALRHLIGAALYLATAGAVGRGSLNAIKEFFAGLGSVISDPGKAFDQWWSEIEDLYGTIEGPLTDCRRAELVVRRVVNALVNVILIFAAGYGAIKAVASGAKGAATLVTAARAGQLGAKLAGAGGRAAAALGRFSAVSARVAQVLLRSLRHPLQALARVRSTLSTLRLAASNVDVWAWTRGQGGRIVEHERVFWQDQRAFWTGRASAQEGRLAALEGEAQALQSGLEQNRAPANPQTVVDDLTKNTEGLAGDVAELREDMLAEPGAQPGKAGPTAAEPKVTEPKVAEPKVTEPKVTEPKQAVEPNVLDRHGDDAGRATARMAGVEVPTGGLRPVNGRINVGGGLESGAAEASNLNPIVQGTGGPTRGIPNHVRAGFEQIADVFEPGSAELVLSNRLPFHTVNWARAARGAYTVLAPGGRLSLNVWTRSAAEVRTILSAFSDAGFRSVTSSGSGPATMIFGVR